MAKMRVVLTCRDCRQQVAQWVGRCPGCGAWGTIEENVRGPVTSGSRPDRAVVTAPLVGDTAEEPRVGTGFAGVDRVLGGGLVPASVALLAGEPGIGKSTLLLHLVAHLASQGQRVPAGQRRRVTRAGGSACASAGHPGRRDPIRARA